MNTRPLFWVVLIAVAPTACNSQTTQTDGDSGYHPIDASLFDVAAYRGLGASCAHGADCDSNICLTNGRCSRPCVTTVDCPAGWACGTLPSSASACLCAPSSEICDGLDNDCDGIIDDGATCPGLAVCVAGSCFSGVFDVSPFDATGIARDSSSNCDGMVASVMDAGTCYSVASCGGNAFCPSLVSNEPTHPQFVIAQLDVQNPAVLGPRMPIGSIFNSAISAGQFFWGLDVDLVSNIIHTGGLLTDMPLQPGTGFLNNDFHFMTGAAPAGDAGTANRWDPVVGTVSLAGESFSTNTINMVTVPIFGTPDDAGQPTLLMELPLRLMRIHDVQMTDGRNCIGEAKSPFQSCLPNRWYTTDPISDAGMNSFGVLEGDLTVADTDRIAVPAILGTPTLCGLISGTGSDCSVSTSMWRTPPETTASGPGWHFVANISGYAARIH